MAEPSAQIASNCGSGIGWPSARWCACCMPALCAFRKSISAQMSPLDSMPPNAGIAGAPDGASMPCEMYQNRSPSVCPQKCAAVRSAGGTGSDFAAGPSPRASAPWHEVQLAANSAWPCTMELSANSVGEVTNVVG